jgi:hypothetical protein
MKGARFINRDCCRPEGPGPPTDPRPLESGKRHSRSHLLATAAFLSLISPLFVAILSLISPLFRRCYRAVFAAVIRRKAA